MIQASPGRRDLFPLLFLTLVLFAWLQLAVWSLSPYARYLDHELLEHLPFSLSARYLGPMSLFVVGWVLMTVAMMLPTSLPLVDLFRGVVRGREDRRQLLALLLAGYLLVWTGFGVAAHFGDLLVHAAVHRSAWLAANSWLIAAGTTALAGIYQFTPLKFRCLDKCRSPLAFITEQWRGHSERVRSLWLGIRHGLFCVGCCWSLMLLMFAFACGNLGWMFGLGAIMAAEKNVSWGRRLSAPLGILLLSAATIVALHGAARA